MDVFGDLFPKKKSSDELFSSIIPSPGGGEFPTNGFCLIFNKPAKRITPPISHNMHYV